MEVFFLDKGTLFLDHRIDIPAKLFDTFKTKPTRIFKNNQLIYQQGEFANKFSKCQWICTKYKKIFILNKNSLLEFLET